MLVYYEISTAKATEKSASESKTTFFPGAKSGEWAHSTLMYVIRTMLAKLLHDRVLVSSSSWLTFSFKTLHDYITLYTENKSMKLHFYCT